VNVFLIELLVLFYKTRKHPALVAWAHMLSTFLCVLIYRGVFKGKRFGSKTINTDEQFTPGY